MLVLLAGIALADGAFFMTEEQWKQNRERSLINEPEQKAVVYFSKGTEQLVISPSYEGPINSFAWVVPVPAKSKVDILTGSIFHELAKLTMPKPNEHMIAKSAAPTGAAPQSVTVIERKTVGAYDVSVLSATDGKALLRWLQANRYHLTDEALAPIRSYVKEGWTFVACRVKVPGSAHGLSTGTLAPLRLTFKARKPVYPMRLSSANPKPFYVLTYLVLPSNEIGGKPDSIRMTGQSYGPTDTRWSATASGYFWNRRHYPTLAKLGRGEMQIYVKKCYVSPRECTADFIWSPPIHQASLN